MEKLSLPHAQLFQLCSELFKKGSINEPTKHKLKEMVINDDPVLFELLKQHNIETNEAEFTQGLLAYFQRTAIDNSRKEVAENAGGQNAIDEASQFVERHPDCPEEISSPLGLKLLKRKQRQQKADPKIKEYLKPFKIQQEQ